MTITVIESSKRSLTVGDTPSFALAFLVWKSSMRAMIKSICILCLLSSGFCACSASSSSIAGGGVVGGAIGAGTGAIIGSVISNGAVGESALLGGAIGIPVGIAIAAMIDYNSQESQEQRYLEQLKQNQQLIFNQERQLERWREEVLKDSPKGTPPEELAEHLYTGPTLGNPYR